MPGWLTRAAADVPPGDGWLSDAERGVQAGLRIERRRADWRLGRCAAKAAVGGALALAPERVAVLAAEDGAPEARVDGAPAGVSLSISHRAGLALVAIASAPRVVGCDLELIEPRSDVFVREWFADGEQAMVLGCADPGQRAALANLVWTAKEAAAKVRREGLRLDARSLVVEPAVAGVPPAGEWRAVRVRWDEDEAVTEGWWRALDGFVMTIACAPPADGPPQPLETRG